MGVGEEGYIQLVQRMKDILSKLWQTYPEMALKHGVQTH